MSDTLSKEQRKVIKGTRKSRKEFAYTPPANMPITVEDCDGTAELDVSCYDEDDARPLNEDEPVAVSPLPATAPPKKHAFVDPGATGYNKKPVKRTYQPAKQNGKGNGKTSKPSQYRDPKINVLDRAMMEIIENRPLRGRVKFFDSRPEKAFGFIIVDSLEITPVGLFTGKADDSTLIEDKLPKEVFFHYNDVGRVDWIGNQHSYPIITLRRDLENYEPAYPQANDRVVFFPIEVLHSHGSNHNSYDPEVRAKAVPWAYEQDWDDAYAAMVEAEHFRYLRVTTSKSLLRKETRSIQWFGSEQDVEEFLKSEEYRDCEEEATVDYATKFQWQIWQPSDHEKVQLDYHEDPNEVTGLCSQWENIQHPDE